MTLQRMRYIGDDGKIRERVCCVSMIHQREYTACGCAIPDTSFKYRDSFEAVGDEYNGRLKDVTCKMCIDTIMYYRGLK